MFTAVDLRLTGLIVVIHLLYFIDIISNISYNLLQNLLFFLPENTKISYFLDFFKSYILIEVDFDHCVGQVLPQLVVCKVQALQVSQASLHRAKT